MFALVNIAAVDPALLQDGIAVSAANSRSSLDRTTGIVETTFELTLSNTGELPIETPLHVAMRLYGEFEPGTAGVLFALGGTGAGPYGTWYFDLSPLAGSALQPGQTLTQPVTYFRPSGVSVKYVVEVYGVVNGSPELQQVPDFQGVTGEPLTLTGIDIIDPDGDPVSYTWVTSTGETATGPSPTFQFDLPGIHEVILQAEDNRGGLLTVSLTVTILPANDIAAARTRTLDGTGLPLGGVAIIEKAPGLPPVDLQSDVHSGFASLGSSSGLHHWTFTKPGYLSAWRQAELTAGAVSRVPNPWLAEIDTTAHPLSVLGVTRLADASGRMVLFFPAGTFEQTGNGYLTTLHGQSLPYPLPRGWSPLAGFDFLADSPPVGPGDFEISLLETVDADESLVLVQFDSNNLDWNTLMVAPGSGSGTFAGQIQELGTYAVVIADKGANAPPATAPGESLPQGPASPLDTSLLQLTGEVLPPTVVASLLPEAVTVEGRITVDGDPLPASGFWLPGRVDEIYTLHGGQDVRTPDYDSTLFSYARPAGGLGGMSIRLPMRSQLLFGPDALLQGKVRMDVFDPQLIGGTILGPEGGILASDGVRIIAPAGALEKPTAAEILSSRIDSYASVAPGTTPVKAFQLNFSGLQSGSPLEFASQPLDPESHYVLARLVISKRDFGLQPVERFASDVDGILQSVEPVGIPRLPGLDRPGQYVLLKVPEAVGLVNGIISGTGGEPLEGVSVRIEGTPWSGVSGSNGTYHMVTAVGGFSILAQDPDTGEEGRADAQLASPADTLQIDFTTALTGPRVILVSPGDAATDVSEVAPVVLRFSKALDPASFGPEAITVLPSEGEGIVSGSLGLNLNATEATFLAANPFERNTTYHIILANTIRDLAGLPIEGSLEFTFTTRPPEIRSLGAQLVVYEPGAANIPAEVLDKLVGYSPGGSLVVAHGSSGTADPEVPVILVNETTGETATVLSNPDGSFANFIYAEEADFISAVFVNENGTRVTVPATKQLFDDGRQGLYRYGGILEAQSDGGPVQVIVEPQAIENRSVFKLEPLEIDDLLALTGGVEPAGDASLIAGVKISNEGDQLDQSAKVRIPVTLQQLGLSPEDDPNEGSFALTVPREVDGVPVFEIIDKVVYENGYLTTTSPPFAGYSGTTSDTVAMARLSFGNSAVIVGRVVSAIDGERDPAVGQHRAVPGAIVFSTEQSPVDQSGKVTSGAMVSIAESKGNFTLMVPVSAFRTTGSSQALALASGSGRFPTQTVFGSATLADPDSVSILTANDLIFNRSIGDSFLGDDLKRPDVTFSQSVRDPNPGDFFSVEFLVTDDRTVPNFLASVVTADPIPTGGAQVFAEDITFDLESNIIAGTSRRVRYRMKSTKPAWILISFTATDGAGNVNSAFVTANVPASDPPPPVAPNPNDTDGPFVLNSRPISGAQFVSPFEPIQLEFNEPIDPGFINSAGQVFVLSPNAGDPYIVQSEDRRSISLQYPKLQPGQGYLLFLNAGPTGLIRDLAGNLFDQIPGGFQDFFSLNFQTEPVLFETNLAVERGVGAAGDREWAYLLDRKDGIKSGTVHIFGRNADDSINVDAPGMIDLELPYPRDLYLINNYDFFFPDPVLGDQLLLEKDLLVVIGGSIAIPDLGGVVSNRDIPWLKVYDVTDPTKPQRRVNIPVRSAVGNALVKMDWSPPILGVMELGSEGVHINLLNLQHMLRSDNLTGEQLADEPDDGDPGLDLNADGDYTDSGDMVPRPSGKQPQLGWINNGLVGGVFMPEGDNRRMVDFSIAQGGALVGAVIRGGQTTPVYRTMLSGGIPTDPGQGELQLDAEPRRILIVMGVPVNLGGTDVQIVNLACITRSGKSDLRVVDITDPLNPVHFVDIEIADTESGTLFTPMLAPDGKNVVIASESNLYLIDPTKIKLATSGNTRPYIVGFLPNGGTPTRRFLTDGGAFYAVASGDKNRIVTDKPTEPVFTTSNPQLIDTNTSTTGGNTTIIERKSKDLFLEIVSNDPAEIKGSVGANPSGLQLPEDFPAWYADDAIENKFQTGVNSLYKMPGNVNGSLSAGAGGFATISATFNVLPDEYDISVTAQALDPSIKHLVKLKVYPVVDVKFDMDSEKLQDLLRKLRLAKNKMVAVGTALNPGPFFFDMEVKGPVGKVSAALAYKECDKINFAGAETHRVFLTADIQPKLDPLFGMTGKLGVKPPLPGIITNFIGDAKIFIEAGGSLSVSGKIGYDQCGLLDLSTAITGKVSLSINAELKAIPVRPASGSSGGGQDYLLELKAKAETEVSMTFTPQLNPSTGVITKFRADYSGLKGEFEAKAAWGDLTWKAETTFIDGGELIPESTTVLID